MNEEIKTEKWNLYVKRREPGQSLDESYVEILFRLNSDRRSINGLSKEDLEELEEDLKDLGKWRRFKELKRELEK